MTLQTPEQLNTISRIDEPAARPEGKRGIPLRTATAVFSLLAFLTAAALFLADRQVNYGYENITRDGVAVPARDYLVLRKEGAK